METVSRKAINESIDRLSETILDWVITLIQIPSVTGDEKDVQAAVGRIMTDVGLRVETLVPEDGLRSHPSFSDDGLPVDRPIVIGRWDGAEAGARSLIYNGHIDVVPPGDESRFPYGAWSGEVRDGSIWGRGACDMKGGLIASIAGLAVLADLGVAPPGDVMIQSVTGEETGGVGTLATVAAGYRADAAIIFEPTSMRICPVGAGSASFRLVVPGLAAHGARRQQGVSAIEKFVVLSAALSDYESSRDQAFVHPAYDPAELVAPISVGRIEAGDWPSTVPERLVAEGRAGVLPGETLAEAQAGFERAVAHAAAGDSWLSEHPPVIEWFEGQFEPATTPMDSPLVAAVAGVHRASFGLEPVVEGVTYGSDLRFFTNDAAMPAVLYGPGDVDLAHTTDERLDVAELLDAVRFAAHFAATWGK